MARRRTTVTAKPQKIYGWPVTSSQEREGRVAKYTVWLYDDGSLSCDCPGWIFHRKKNDGMCKHTRSVKDEAKDLLARHKRGEELPSEVNWDTTVQRAPTTATSSIKFGRFIEV